MPQVSYVSDSKEDWEAVYDASVIEEAPSHDGAPCFSAWEGPRPFMLALEPEDLERIGEGEDHINPQRPLYGIQIYDTTPDAGDPEHVRRMALTLHKLTFQYDGAPSGVMSRTDSDGCWVDRIDVFGLPMPEGTPTRERVDRCIAHSKQEIVHRILTFGADWYIPPTYKAPGHKRVVYIIDREEARWDDKETGEEGEEGGPFITAQWAYTRGSDIFPGEQDMPGAPPMGWGMSAEDVNVPATLFYRFDDVLGEFGGHIFAESTKWFNGQYAAEVCTCDGEEDATCQGGACGCLAHDVKVYKRLLRAGKGRELIGEFEFQVDTIGDVKNGAKDGSREVVEDSAKKNLEIRTIEKEE